MNEKINVDINNLDDCYKNLYFLMTDAYQLKEKIRKAANELGSAWSGKASEEFAKRLAEDAEEASSVVNAYYVLIENIKYAVYTYEKSNEDALEILDAAEKQIKGVVL